LFNAACKDRVNDGEDPIARDDLKNLGEVRLVEPGRVEEASVRLGTDVQDERAGDGRAYRSAKKFCEALIGDHFQLLAARIVGKERLGSGHLLKYRLLVGNCS
jgi:hypothetical protein